MDSMYGSAHNASVKVDLRAAVTIDNVASGDGSSQLGCHHS